MSGATVSRRGEDAGAAKQRSSRILSGTIYVFLAEALLLPTGLLTAAFLTRRLGLNDYGLFTLAATLVSWIEWSLTSMFTRTTIKFVGDAGDDWRPVADTVVWLHLIASVAVALLLCLIAAPLAALFREPSLVNYLRLFALDIPIFALAYAHRSILTGLGSFTQRAHLSAGRWIARLVFIVLLVEAGLSIEGAILGSIAASLVELGIARFYVRPSFRRSAFSPRSLCDYAVPLFLCAVCLRFFEKIDLLMLKALGGTASDAGIYGAAQNLALVPSLFALAFTPLLLSTINRKLRLGDDAEARVLSRDAMRFVLMLMPFASMTAGAAPEVVLAIFGASFSPAATPLALLIFGSIALVMISVATVILIAAGRPAWTLRLAAPLPLAAVLGHSLLIPPFGVAGAAIVTSLVATLGAVASVAAVFHSWRVVPRPATFVRVALICFSIYALCAAWSTSGGLLLLKLSLAALAVPCLFGLLGEFTADEIASARALLRGRVASLRPTSAR